MPGTSVGVCDGRALKPVALPGVDCQHLALQLRTSVFSVNLHVDILELLDFDEWFLRFDDSECRFGNDVIESDGLEVLVLPHFSNPVGRMTVDD